MATTDPVGNKGRRYAGQVLDESFFGEQVPWTSVADGYELSLHFGNPEAADGSLTNEITYPGYARARLPRDRLSWARTGTTVTNRIEARVGVRGEAVPVFDDDELMALAAWAGRLRH